MDNDAQQSPQPKQQIILPPAPTAPSLLGASTVEKKLYWDRSHYDSPESQMLALKRSATLYIGNLAFSTRTSHIKALFSSLGQVSNVILGLDRIKKTPCGFAFVEYVKREDALRAVSLLSGCKLDERVIRVELDAGFKPGRQFGRGQSGGQVRDDRRGTVDRGRAGTSRGNRSNNDGRMSSNRWQAPQRPYHQNNNRNYYGSGSTDSSGNKRTRDDAADSNEYADEPKTKNSRFQDNSDDEA